MSCILVLCNANMFDTFTSVVYICDIYSDMGACCSKCFRDLREDTVQFPVQCEDTEENEVASVEDNNGLADDFIDLRVS